MRKENISLTIRGPFSSLVEEKVSLRRRAMVEPPVFYSNTKPTVHDCAHIDTCEYISDSAMRDAKIYHSIPVTFRICRTCGQKDQRLRPSNYHFSVLNRSSDFVTGITRDEYLAIERSFDVKKPEYRARLMRQVREAVEARVLTADELREIWALLYA